MSQQTILVIGATGTVGAPVARQLREDGYHVRLLVRDPNTGSAEQRRLATLPAGHAQGDTQCFEAFVADTYAAVRGETRDGLPTFDDGLRSANVIEAVLKSSATQRWMTIEP